MWNDMKKRDWGYFKRPTRNYRVDNNKYSGEVINNSVWHDRQSNHVNQMDEWRAFSDEKSKWKKTYLIKLGRLHQLQTQIYKMALLNQEFTSTLFDLISPLGHEVLKSS